MTKRLRRFPTLFDAPDDTASDLTSPAAVGGRGYKRPTGLWFEREMATAVCRG